MAIVIGHYKEANMHFVRIIKTNGTIIRCLFNTEKEAIDYTIRYLKGI